MTHPGFQAGKLALNLEFAKDSPMATQRKRTTAKKSSSASKRKILRRTVAPMAAKGRAGTAGGDSKPAQGEAKAEEAKASQEPAQEAAPAPEPKPAEPPPPAPSAAPAEPEYAEKLPPQAIPQGKPTDAAPPPGLAPKGDARSLRRHGDDGEEFCFIYRIHDKVITRQGIVGQLGSWNVVQYPGNSHAAHAYAQECSRLTTEGFRDLR
jgi:hypothetical protein